METTVPQIVLTTCIASSFMVAGNSITNTYMAIPALLTDFPPPGSPNHHQAVQHMGRLWPNFNHAGHVFFRPIGTFSFLGYSLRALHASRSVANTEAYGDWRLFAIAGLCHLAVMLHSNFNMGRLNKELSAYANTEKGSLMGNEAACEVMVKKWARWNMVRVFLTLIAGVCGLTGCY